MRIIPRTLMPKTVILAMLLASAISLKAGAQTLAEVKGEKITQEQIQNRYDALAPQIRQQNSLEQIQPQLVRQAVIEKIFALEARAQGLDKNKDVKAAFTQAQESILNQFYVRQFSEKSVTKDELQKEYDSFKKNYNSGTEYRARHILVKTEAEAVELIKKLDKGSNFAELAKTYSTGPSASRGGDLGYFREGAMVRPFETAVKLLDSGQYTKKPVKTNFGWHVIILEDKRQAEAPPLEQVKDQLQQHITDAKLQQHLRTLEQKYQVKINN